MLNMILYLISSFFLCAAADADVLFPFMRGGRNAEIETVQSELIM